MNFCVAYDGELIYVFTDKYIKIFKCKFNIGEINLKDLKENSTYLEEVERANYSKEYTVVELFCEFFITDKFKGYTFLSHYGKGYDMQPILAWLPKHKIAHTFISSGLKITAIKINGVNIRFIDSFNFTICGLAKFPNTFDFKGNKGYFPHYFNIEENQRYKGVYPDKKYYGYNTMTIKNKELFDKWYYFKIWYDTVKDNEFNFKKEIFHYCLLDVLILAKGCTIFRDLFLKITTNYIDPFQSITIAQCCKRVFRTLMLKKSTIGIHKRTTFEDNQSKKAIQWLEYKAK